MYFCQNDSLFGSGNTAQPWHSPTLRLHPSLCKSTLLEPGVACAYAVAPCQFVLKKTALLSLSFAVTSVWHFEIRHLTQVQYINHDPWETTCTTAQRAPCSWVPRRKKEREVTVRDSNTLYNCSSAVIAMVFSSPVFLLPSRSL